MSEIIKVMSVVDKDAKSAIREKLVALDLEELA